MGWWSNVKAAVKQVFDEYEKKPEVNNETNNAPVEETSNEQNTNPAEHIYNEAKKQEEMRNRTGETQIQDDVYTNVKWGTAAPITVQNLSKGMVQLVARGTCDFEIVDRAKFSSRFNYSFDNPDEGMLQSLVSHFIVVELGNFLRHFPIDVTSNLMMVSMGSNFTRTVTEKQEETGIKFNGIAIMDIHEAN